MSGRDRFSFGVDFPASPADWGLTYECGVDVVMVMDVMTVADLSGLK